LLQARVIQWHFAGTAVSATSRAVKRREGRIGMPWESEGDNVKFSGPLADLMGAIMAAFEQDNADGSGRPTPGEYVTASAVVLREVLLENLEEAGDTSEFFARISDALSEDEDGNVQIATFALLDDIAEQISPEALDAWLSADPVRSAIMELATTAFA
jgi:hypothetical protein